MRQLSAEARLHLYARSLSRKTGTGFHAAALYGAFAVIAAVVFLKNQVNNKFNDAGSKLSSSGS